jgi:hypothetical protein
VEWLAQLVVHIPGRYEHAVRYYGNCSNKSRGLRKKIQANDQIAAIMPTGLSSAQFSRNRACLIRQSMRLIP